jgi:hypothetical protein
LTIFDLRFNGNDNSNGNGRNDTPAHIAGRRLLFHRKS